MTAPAQATLAPALPLVIDRLHRLHPPGDQPATGPAHASLLVITLRRPDSTRLETNP